MLRDEHELRPKILANALVLRRERLLRQRRVEKRLAEAHLRHAVDPSQLLLEAREVGGAQRHAALFEPRRHRIHALIPAREIGVESREVVGERREPGRCVVRRPVVGVGRLEKERRLGAALDDEPIATPRVAIHRPNGEGAALTRELGRGSFENRQAICRTHCAVVPDHPEPLGAIRRDITPPERASGAQPARAAHDHRRVRRVRDDLVGRQRRPVRRRRL